MALRTSVTPREGVENRRVIAGIGLRMGMARCRRRAEGPRPIRAIAVSASPSNQRAHDMSAKSATPASWPAARAANRSSVAAGVERLDSPLDHFAGTGELPHEEPNHGLAPASH